MPVINDISTADPVVIPVGVTEPPLLLTIPAPDGSTQDMTGATVMLFMRPLLSRTPIETNGTASPIAPADDDGHNVRYDWGSNDTMIEGAFMGWVGYELPATALAETPEFRIIVTDHGPGFGHPTGAIVDAINQWLPVTLNRLRQDPSFGDRFLQRHADYIKRIVMGTVVTPDNEDLYDPILVDYLAKRTAIRIIPAAKDFWARQYTSVSAQGPSENATYPNMLQNLDSMRCRLEIEAAQDWRQMKFLGLGLPQLRVEPAPASSLGEGRFDGPVTPDPRYTSRQRTGGPRWGLFFE